MPNGPKNETTKKLLNNDGLKAEWAAMAQTCSTAEECAEAFTADELLLLCDADKVAAAALRQCRDEYARVFKRVEGRVYEELKRAEQS